MKNSILLNRVPRRKAGLTLVEIIVVLIILASLMAFFGSRLFGAGDRAKADLNNLKLQEIKQAIEQFQLRYSSLPRSLDSLTQCTDETGAGCIPMLKPESLKDIWGFQFVYALENSGRSYKLTSLGKDGRDGGAGVDYDQSIVGP